MRESGQNVRAVNRPKWVTELIGVLADILIAAVILLVFAYIHHGRAYLFGKLEADMASAVPVSSVADAPVRDEQPVWLNTHDEKFLTSGVEQTDSSYRSENISIELSRHEDNRPAGGLLRRGYIRPLAGVYPHGDTRKGL